MESITGIVLIGEGAGRKGERSVGVGAGRSEVEEGSASGGGGGSKFLTEVVDSSVDWPIALVISSMFLLLMM